MNFCKDCTLFNPFDPLYGRPSCGWMGATVTLDPVFGNPVMVETDPVVSRKDAAKCGPDAAGFNVIVIPVAPTA
jgi:hypothetical protein